MSEFTLTIRTDDDAFTPTPHSEVAGLLHSIADRVAEGRDNGLIIGSNGTSVGTYVFTDDEGNPS